MKRKLTCFLLTFIFCLCDVGIFSGCHSGCQVIGLRLDESEYFIYTLSYGSNDIGIAGLTDKGQEQEYLVIPETIDNHKVARIDGGVLEEKAIIKKYGDAKYVGLQSACLKKVFIVPKVLVLDASLFFGYETNQLSVFYMSNDMRVAPNSNYDYYYTKDNQALSQDGIRNHKANVSYYYNYENAPNDGYYWIDNYAYGETIEYIPATPIRNGYTFGGWYKESECINAWDFENDTLTEVQYDEEEIEIYQETKLFAKWI